MKKFITLALAITLPLALISASSAQSNQTKFNRARDIANAKAREKAREAFAEGKRKREHGKLGLKEGIGSKDKLNHKDATGTHSKSNDHKKKEKKKGE